MKIRPVGTELLHAAERTQTETRKVIVVFFQFCEKA